MQEGVPLQIILFYFQTSSQLSKSMCSCTFIFAFYFHRKRLGPFSCLAWQKNRTYILRLLSCNTQNQRAKLPQLPLFNVLLSMANSVNKSSTVNSHWNGSEKVGFEEINFQHFKAGPWNSKSILKVPRPDKKRKAPNDLKARNFGLYWEYILNKLIKLIWGV